MLEPTPDDKHLNNRSGVLQLYLNSKPGAGAGAGAGAPPLVYSLAVDGNGAADPQSVAVSAYGDGAGRYTAAALIGFHTVVVDFDAKTSTGTVVYNKVQPGGGDPEIAVAVSADGNHYAVTNEAQVDVFVRDPAAQRFRLLGSINAPENKLYPGQGS